MIHVPAAPRHRREDYRLLVGEGCFVDDISMRNSCVGIVVRSDLPHARILEIDAADAEAMPGVQAVLTGAALESMGIGNMPSGSGVVSRDGTPAFAPPRPVLAIDRVRHIGDPVAFIVAESHYEALDAAELIGIEYEELPSTVDLRQSLSGEPVIWPGEHPNQSFDWEMGDRAAVSAAFEAAAHCVELEMPSPRVAVCPIEPRAAAAVFDPETESFKLHVQTQGVHSVRDALADVLKIDSDRLRVITQDVGGSFGMKIFTYPEYALVLIAARMVGRPVKWTATRSESFLSDAHGRGRIDKARLAFDEEGRMMALEYDALGDLGAYLSRAAAHVPSIYAATVVGHTYRIPNICFRSRGVFTNAVPTDAYRGAGKPETVCTVEHLIDKAALQLGVDRIELRRINLVRPDEIPYSMPNGQVIDSGDFEALLDRALELSKWHGFSKRRAESAASGKLRGIGLGMYMHSTGGSSGEVCEVAFETDGTVRILTGTQSGGGGHETSLAALAGASLDIDISRITVIQGDTDAHDTGGGTGGSSLLAVAGSTVQRAAAIALGNARNAASELLEVASADLEYSKGEFRIPGTDRRLSLSAVARHCGQRPSIGECAGHVQFEGKNTTHPSGAYVAELECDPATGSVSIVQLTGVDDLGRILFPDMVDGQLHGAWAQSVGAALMERAEYDADATGQPMNASFMDYGLPRADDMPSFTLDKLTTLSKVNPLGTKGAGEVASLGAPGAIFNALSDMLSTESFVAFDGPAAPLRVWRKLHNSTQP